MFVLHRRTKIVSEVHTKPVENAIAILQRDMNVYLRRKDVYGPMYEMNKKMQEREDQQEFKGKNNEIQLVYNQELAEEAYRLTVETERILIEAADDLGFVYGLLFISSEFLKVSPFWYWMENTQKLGKYVELEEKVYESPKPVVRFRGWFFNDEVLFMKWHIDDDHDTTWKMAFETLLRCGGNMAIPGTDKEARCNWKLAAEMGLWITHHHAEPLGAEMFIRAYPNEEPNYLENTALFEKLWEDAVIEQKDYKVIWNLCFRGQGDAPFWASDTSGQFNTPEKRGALISQVVRKQSEFVKKYVKDPIFCTNLYGEIMELYKEGCLDLDPNVIKVRADNGYAKMVTRRRDNHTVRVSSMPDPEDKSPQGIYYHVSFYDLQAANHITMLPNSVNFVDNELANVLANGGNDFWVINCSNVRPHVYFLDAIRKIWFGQRISDESHSQAFADEYYKAGVEAAKCYQAYSAAMPKYGPEEDQHAGEQFYTENVRIIAHHMMLGNKKADELVWLTGNVPLRRQVKKIMDICSEAEPKLKALYEQCKEVGKSLRTTAFSDQIEKDLGVHWRMAKGTHIFCEAYEEFRNKNYKKAFVRMGDSWQIFKEADELLQKDDGKWKNYYGNDCLADIKHTAYMAKKAMGYIREVGDNVRHDQWYRDEIYAPEDQKVFLLLVTDRHMTDKQLYEAMKSKY